MKNLYRGRPTPNPSQGRGIISCRVRTYVSALFVIVTVPVIAVGAGSARPNMVQTTDCTDLHRFLGTETATPHTSFVCTPKRSVTPVTPELQYRAPAMDALYS